jgi:gliding-associated putative ABC transporter substrate-binding component GldG
MVNAGTGKPQMQLRPWMYFPLFIPSSGHPIVKNMDAVMGMFTNSIDTTGSKDIKKTVLLESSKYSRATASPVRVSLGMLKFPPNPQHFDNPYRPVAVLMEGKFKSVFENRLSPAFLHVLRDSLKREFRPAAEKPGAMIVIADGDMLENDYSQTMGPMEMGYWQYTKDRFANKNFVLNCLEYLTDDAGLLEARSKDVRLRLLDTARVKKEKATWQALNIGLPIVLVLVFASCYLFFRKRRYEKKA